MMFAAQFAPIRGIWAGFRASARSPYRGTVDQNAIPIDLVACLEFCEQSLEKVLPDAGLLPASQMTQAGEPRRKIARSRQKPPRHTGSQDKQDARDNLAKVRWLASSELNMPILPRFGQQRFQTFPEIVG